MTDNPFAPKNQTTSGERSPLGEALDRVDNDVAEALNNDINTIRACTDFTASALQETELLRHDMQLKHKQLRVRGDLILNQLKDCQLALDAYSATINHLTESFK